jgi:hypothetical protein
VRPRGRRSPPRDQRESAFAGILADFLRRVPGARAAALVDSDGETVDYCGRGSPYEVRVAAAHFRILLDEARGQPSLSGVRSIVVRAARASFAVQALPDGYALVVRLARGGGFRGLVRAIPACIQSLSEEAGWRAAPCAWYAVDVTESHRGAPVDARPSGAARAGQASSVEILGRYRAALPEHERAWRVRLSTGVELTLVRESGGFWYADEPLTAKAASGARGIRPPSQPGKKNL